MICSVFGIHRSVLYNKSKIAEKDEVLLKKIKDTLKNHPYYWYPRISLELWINKKRIHRIMKNNWLSAKQRKRKKFIKSNDIWFAKMKIENIKKKIIKYENKKYLENEKYWEDNKNYLSVFNMPNTILATDFTHLYWRWYEFYLATIIDNYTKEVVWCNIWFHHDQDFIIWTTKNAISKTFKLFWFLPIWLHSDQWSEYRSQKHLKLLEDNWIKPSMSKKSSPWKNGLQEWFYWKLKLEIWDLNRFNSLEEAIAEVYWYIYYYNNKRIHTTIKMTPVEFRKIEQEKIREEIKNNKNYFKNRDKIFKEMEEKIKNI